MFLYISLIFHPVLMFPSHSQSPKTPVKSGYSSPKSTPDPPSAEPTWLAGQKDGLEVSDPVELGQTCSWLGPQSSWCWRKKIAQMKKGFVSHFPICLCLCGIVLIPRKRVIASSLFRALLMVRMVVFPQVDPENHSGIPEGHSPSLYIISMGAWPGFHWYQST